MTQLSKVDQLKADWANNARWTGVLRPYTAEEVLKLRSKVEIEYSIAKTGAEKLWKRLKSQSYVAALGARLLKRLKKILYLCVYEATNNKGFRTYL